MFTRINKTYEEIRTEYYEKLQSDSATPFDKVFAQTALDANMSLEAMIRQAQTIIGRMERVIQKAEEYGLAATVNSEGELQGAGSLFDAECARFSAFQETMITLAATASQDQ